MKNLFFILGCLCPMILNAQYSEPTRIFSKGQVDVQASVGLFPTYVADHPQSIVPPLQAEIRWMAASNVSLSLFTGYSYSMSREELITNEGKSKLKNQTWFWGVTSGFHYTRIDNWDLYGGLSILYQQVHIDMREAAMKKEMAHYGIRPLSGRMAITAFIGTRFGLTPRSTVIAELGYGVSLLKIGIGYRIAGGR